MFKKNVSGYLYKSEAADRVMGVLLRNDKDFEGITIDLEEYKLSKICRRHFFKNKNGVDSGTFFFLRKYLTIPDENSVEMIVFLIS